MTRMSPSRMGLLILLCWTVACARLAFAAPQQILVKFTNGGRSTAAISAHKALGTTVAYTSKFTGWQVVNLPAGTTVARALADYRAKPGVAAVAPNGKRYATDLPRPAALPNDPRYPQLWGMAKISAPFVWDYTTGSRDVVVAVIDTGVDYEHPDLAANMWTNSLEIAGNGIDDDGNGYADDVHGINAITDSGDPMDDQEHGTHCAGTIGGVGDNGVGVAGVNWRVSIMALKFLGDDGGTDGDAIKCYDYLIAMRQRGVNVRVVNNSWGGGGDNPALRDAFEAAGALGILSCCAAGNGGDDQVGDDNDADPQYPSSYDCASIIAVAASDQEDRRAAFSNYGATSVDLAAPGVGITSTIPNDAYGGMSGTSMATPHVTGACALILALAPSLTGAQLKQLLLDSVDVFPEWHGRVLTGGRLNVATVMNRLVPRLLEPANDAVLSTTSVTLSWTPVSGVTQYQVQVARDDHFTQIVVNMYPTATSLAITRPAGPYWWRVRASMPGQELPWSTVWHFTIEPGPVLGVPRLLSPADRALLRTSEVTLRWSSVPQATEYDVQVASDAGFTSIALTRTVSTPDVTASFSNGQYWWRVRARKNATVGGWSLIRSFTVNQTLGLGIPILVSPINTAGSVPVGPARFTWQGVASAETYWLQISGTNDFRNLIVNTTSIRGLIAQVNYLAKDTTYYWRVKAIRGSTQSGWSQVWSFTTAGGNTTPIATTLLTPADGATNVVVPARFTWTPVPEAQSYWLQVSRNEQFTGLVANLSALRITYSDVRTLAPNTRYFWRVKATNARGLSVWSSVWSLTTKSNVPPPAAPRLLSPTTGATGVNRPVHCTWSTVSGASMYQAQASTTSNFAVIAEEANTALTQVDLTSLAANTRYYWRVRALRQGAYSAWSSTGYFTTTAGGVIIILPPPAPNPR